MTFPSKSGTKIIAGNELEPLMHPQLIKISQALDRLEEKIKLWSKSSYQLDEAKTHLLSIRKHLHGCDITLGDCDNEIKNLFTQIRTHGKLNDTEKGFINQTMLKCRNALSKSTKEIDQNVVFDLDIAMGLIDNLKEPKLEKLPIPKVLTDPPAPPSNNKIITKCIFMALVYFLPMITVLVYTEQYVWAAIFWFITIAVSAHNIQVEIEERDSND